MSLKTDYKDAIPASGAGTLRKYQMIDNGDGTVSLQDVTEYLQVGDKAQASVFNATNNEVNAHKADTVAHMTQAQKDQLAAAVPNSRKINSHALTGDVTVTKSDLGLGNVDNTADANKSVNYANSAGSAPANGGTAADTQTVSSALTMVSGGTEPSGTLSPGKLWAGY